MDLSWLTEETITLVFQGVCLTVGLTVVTSVAALVGGVLAGTMRLNRQRRWRWLAAAHVETHRNIPALVLIIFWAFAVPNLFPIHLRQLIFFDNPLMRWLGELCGLSLAYYGVAVCMALTLNTSAYIAELFRAGVGNIPQEHVDAARSLGASPLALFGQILLPEGLRIAFPAISTRLIHNMKNTALATFVSVPELFHSTQSAITRSFRAVEFLVVAALLYLLLAVLLGAGLRGIEYLLNRRAGTQLYGSHHPEHVYG